MIPAKAGDPFYSFTTAEEWVPAFAGIMTLSPVVLRAFVVKNGGNQ
jgi:hypothetical protein